VKTSLFGFIDIEPGEGGIPAYCASVIIERRALGLGIELLALAFEPTLIGARQVLTQSDGEFGEVVAAHAERLAGVHRQFFQTAGELWIGQLCCADRFPFLALITASCPLRMG